MYLFCRYDHFFSILGQKFVKFFVGFLENLRHQKDILRLTDLYKAFKDPTVLTANKNILDVNVLEN